MNKKGISPLIGTVLLVAIVIAMILLIMPWVTDMIEKQKEKSGEAARQFDCITGLKFDLNADAAGVVSVTNKGDVAIESVTFRTFDVASKALEATKEVKSGTAGTPLVLAYDTVDMASTDVACATGKKVVATATITSEGEPLVCGESPQEVYC
jgi:flagellin-like protein